MQPPSSHWDRAPAASQWREGNNKVVRRLQGGAAADRHRREYPVAYQLNGWLSVFWHEAAILDDWLRVRQHVTEPDGVRILERRFVTPTWPPVPHQHASLVVMSRRRRFASGGLAWCELNRAVARDRLSRKPTVFHAIDDVLEKATDIASGVFLSKFSR